MSKENIALVLKYIGEDFWSCPVYEDQFKRLWKDIDLGDSEKPNLHSVGDNEFDGDPDRPMKEGTKYTILPLPAEILISEEKKFQYMMLNRLQSDCEYYLGYGNRYSGHLYYKDEKEHLEHMKALWNGFSNEEKPVWLTKEQLEEYEKKMLKSA